VVWENKWLVTCLWFLSIPFSSTVLYRDRPILYCAVACKGNWFAASGPVAQLQLTGMTIDSGGTGVLVAQWVMGNMTLSILWSVLHSLQTAEQRIFLIMRTLAGGIYLHGTKLSLVDWFTLWNVPASVVVKLCNVSCYLSTHFKMFPTSTVNHYNKYILCFVIAYVHSDFGVQLGTSRRSILAWEDVAYRAVESQFGARGNYAHSRDPRGPDRKKVILRDRGAPPTLRGPGYSLTPSLDGPGSLQGTMTEEENRNNDENWTCFRRWLLDNLFCFRYNVFFDVFSCTKKRTAWIMDGGFDQLDPDICKNHGLYRWSVWRCISSHSRRWTELLPVLLHSSRRHAVTTTTAFVRLWSLARILIIRRSTVGSRTFTELFRRRGMERPAGSRHSCAVTRGLQTAP